MGYHNENRSGGIGMNIKTAKEEVKKYSKSISFKG